MRNKRLKGITMKTILGTRVASRLVFKAKLAILKDKVQQAIDDAISIIEANEGKGMTSDEVAIWVGESAGLSESQIEMVRLEISQY